MTGLPAQPETSIRVEFGPISGVQQTSVTSPVQMAEASEKALAAAMESIRTVAARVATMTKEIPSPPTQAEVEFGLKLTGEGHALISKVGGECHFTVKLTWARQSTGR